MIPPWLKTRTIQTEKEELSVGFILTVTSPYEGSRSDRAMQMHQYNVLETIARAEHDIIVGPEYAYFGDRPLTAEQKERYEEELKKATKGKDCLVVPGSMIWIPAGSGVRNTTTGFSQGSALFHYNKCRDGGERHIARKYGLACSYGVDPGIFLWREYFCGIEICADGGYLEARKVEELDLRFFIACGRDETKMQALKTGGYLIVNDGQAIGETYQRIVRKEP